MIHRELLIDGHFIGGPCDQAVAKQVVRAPFDGAIVGTAAEGGWNELNACLQAATDAFTTWRLSARHERQALLRRIAALSRERKDELVDVMAREVAKPVTWARAEVDRLARTFDYAADVLTDYGVEALPVDMDPRGEGHRCLVERFPVGPVFCIVPYNWPYNLAGHKIAPALAVGNTLVLKPSEKASLSTLTLARLIHEAGCPPGVVNAWNGPVRDVGRAIEDPRTKMLSFTGSPKVGWSLKAKLFDRKVALELGGNAFAIVHEDANLDWAVRRIAAAGYGYAGQVCIAAQHVCVHRSVYERFKEALVEETNRCPVGDPLDPKTVCGPLIDEAAADKVARMVDEAIQVGAKLLAGGSREGSMMSPTLLEGVPRTAELANEEVFGPVLTLDPYDNFEEVVQRVNASRYGIHTGLFTDSLALAERAFQALEVGGVIVNDSPALRFDNMPYGGVRSSGFGREGVRYAMDEMTEPRVRIDRSA
jgi:acyl-CoA reductase-like NAD-dependent aldehyde dehydrogenase